MKWIIVTELIAGAAKPAPGVRVNADKIISYFTDEEGHTVLDFDVTHMVIAEPIEEIDLQLAASDVELPPHPYSYWKPTALESEANVSLSKKDD